MNLDLVSCCEREPYAGEDGVYALEPHHADPPSERSEVGKHSAPRPGYKRFPEASLQSVYGEPFANQSVSLFREPDAGHLPVRLCVQEKG